MQLMYKHQGIAQSDVLIEVCITLLLLETLNLFIMLAQGIIDLLVECYA